jgi:hypothetical protein
MDKRCTTYYFKKFTHYSLTGIIGVFFLLLNQTSLAQETPRIVEFTGICVSSDSITPIPLVHITSKNKNYATFANLSGKFSIVAYVGDTLKFTHVQYKTAYYAIPDTLSGKYYHMIQALTSDTNYLPGVIVTAKPSREVFDKLFLTTEIPETKLDIAMRNLEREKLLQQARALEPDAYENYRNFISYQNNQQYNKGMISPSLSLLSPIAWAQFFRAWKDGEFKSGVQHKLPHSIIESSYFSDEN